MTFSPHRTSADDSDGGTRTITGFSPTRLEIITLHDFSHAIHNFMHYRKPYEIPFYHAGDALFCTSSSSSPLKCASHLRVNMPAGTPGPSGANSTLTGVIAEHSD